MGADMNYAKLGSWANQLNIYTRCQSLKPNSTESSVRAAYRKHEQAKKQASEGISCSF